MSSSWPFLTQQQARALARFLHELRSDWDIPGVEHHLGVARDRAPAPELAVAAIRAAASAHNRTPAVIGMDGEHWRAPASTTTTRPRPVHPSELCRVCGLDEDRCRKIAANPRDGHRFERVGDPVLADPTTGEVIPTRDPREAVAQLRAEMAGALAMPD